MRDSIDLGHRVFIRIFNFGDDGARGAARDPQHSRLESQSSPRSKGTCAPSGCSKRQSLSGLVSVGTSFAIGTVRTGQEP